MEGEAVARSKLVSKCKSLAAASYKCLEANPTNGQTVCKQQFDAYKECRKAEHTEIIEERKARGARIG